MQATKVSTVHHSVGVLPPLSRGNMLSCWKVQRKTSFWLEEAVPVILSGAWPQFKTTATQFSKTDSVLHIVSTVPLWRLATVSGKTPSRLPSYPLSHLQPVWSHNTHRYFTECLIPLINKNTILYSGYHFCCHLSARLNSSSICSLRAASLPTPSSFPRATCSFSSTCREDPKNLKAKKHHVQHLLKLNANSFLLFFTFPPPCGSTHRPWSEVCVPCCPWPSRPLRPPPGSLHSPGDPQQQPCAAVSFLRHIYCHATTEVTRSSFVLD